MTTNQIWGKSLLIFIPSFIVHLVLGLWINLIYCSLLGSLGMACAGIYIICNKNKVSDGNEITIITFPFKSTKSNFLIVNAIIYSVIGTTFFIVSLFELW